MNVLSLDNVNRVIRLPTVIILIVNSIELSSAIERNSLGLTTHAIRGGRMTPSHFLLGKDNTAG